jgi:hypothetical protein
MVKIKGTGYLHTAYVLLNRCEQFQSQAGSRDMCSVKTKTNPFSFSDLLPVTATGLDVLTGLLKQRRGETTAPDQHGNSTSLQVKYLIIKKRGMLITLNKEEKI